MLGLIPLRDWLYLGVIIGLIALGAYERQHLINEGEAKCLAREREAAAQQAIQDTKIAQDTTDALNLEIARLRGAIAPPGAPPVPVRVQCYARKVPAAASVTGTAHTGEPAASGGSIPEVPPGPGTGIELGANLQRLAYAADYGSALHRACLKELKEP